MVIEIDKVILRNKIVTTPVEEMIMKAGEESVETAGKTQVIFILMTSNIMKSVNGNSNIMEK